MSKPKLATVQKAVIRSCTPNNSALPILNKISCNRTWESVAGNNLDVQFAVHDGRRLSCNVFDPDSSFLLDRKTALDCIGREITSNGEGTIRIGGREIPFTSFEEYPTLPAGELAEAFSLDWDSCRDSFRWLSQAISTDLTRPTICGVRVVYEPHRHEVLFEATNGHILFRDRLPYQTLVIYKSYFPEFIIPHDLVVTLGKLPACRDATISFSVGDPIGNPAYGRIVVNFGEFVADFLYRQVEGPYPDTNSIFPESFDIRRSFDIAWLDAALVECIAVGSEVTHQCIIETTENKTVVSAQHPDNGTFRTEVDGYHAPSECFRVSFNASYLRSILSGTDADAPDGVTFRMNEVDCATEWELSETRKALLVPLRLVD